MRRKQKGFSLVELLIVVAIILVIAAVAIPNLLRSRMSANEASAVASTKNGYLFTYAAASGSGANNTYTLNADPVATGVSGQRHFFTDATDVLRVNAMAVASASDPAL